MQSAIFSVSGPGIKHPRGSYSVEQNSKNLHGTWVHLVRGTLAGLITSAAEPLVSSHRGYRVSIRFGIYIPIAFPVAQKIKLMAKTTDFLVWPPTFRDRRESPNVCAAQKDSVM